MKSENFQSHFLSCCQEIQKLKLYCLKKNLKLLEYNVNYLDNSEYNLCKSKLDQFYEEKANGIRIRSKCDWYK